MSKRTKRGLSSEDRALWHEVARTVTRQEPVVPYLDPTEIPEVLRDADPLPVKVKKPRQLTPNPPKKRAQPAGKAPTFTDLPADVSPSMDRRNFKRLVTGRMDIDATLDLHGMTADQARQRLIDFVTRAHFSQLRLLLVITGKGNTAHRDEFGREKRAVIRSSLPDWLRGASLSSKVLQVTQAHPKHGGAGAFYVYLRRKR